MPDPVIFRNQVALNIGNFPATGNQFFPNIVALPTGRIFAGWTTNNGNQLGYFHSDGLTGTALRVFSVTNGSVPAFDGQIDLATRANGTQVAVWKNNAADTGDLNYQIFDLVTGAGALIPIPETAAQTEAVVNSSGATSKFTIVYSGGFGQDVFRRSFEANGDGDLGVGELSSGTAVTGAQEQPNLASLTDGRQIAVWSDRNDGTVKGRFLLEGGDRLGSTLNLSTTAPPGSLGQDDMIGVSGLPGGGFVIAYAHPGGGSGVQYRLFNTAGGPATGLLTATGLGFFAPAALGLTDGRFILAAQNNVQIFNADGTANSAVFNIPVAGNQPSLALLPDGRVAVATAVSSLAGGELRDIAMTIIDPRIAGVTVNGTAGEDEYYGSAFVDTLNGGAGADRLEGGAGDDTLDGGSGADVMGGGAGNDACFVDNALDAVIEAANEGTDRVFTALAAYTLPANVENLTGTLVAAQTLNGNGLANVIGAALNSPGASLNGLGGVDTLAGSNGGDFIDGGTGADTMAGGFGADTYVVDDAGDSIIETSAELTVDRVLAALAAYTLGANVENLTGTSAAAQTLNGNGLDNVIVAALNSPGSSLNGFAGVDALTGSNGADFLDGGTDADVMAGGAGNDAYFVDDAGDVVTEAAGAGTDQVLTALAAYTLGANVENLAGASAGFQTLVGNDLGNVITVGAGANSVFGQGGDDYVVGGNGGLVADGGAGLDQIFGGNGADYLIGADGDDVIVGLGGADSMFGGAGDDYMVAGDGPGAVLDGGAGANQLWGANGADYFVGGEGADLIVGGAGAEFEFGNAGDDTLYGGQGGDFLFGNAGNDFIWSDDVGLPQSQDFIYVGGGTGVDTVADFTPGDGANHDVVVISPASGIGNFAQVKAAMTQAGIYTVISMSGGDQLFLYNVLTTDLTANDFIFI